VILSLNLRKKIKLLKLDVLKNIIFVSFSEFVPKKHFWTMHFGKGRQTLFFPKQMFWKNIKFQVILLLAVILVLAVGLTVGLKSKQEEKPVENSIPTAVTSDPKVQ
jgi:uncharacterized membrane protein